MILPNGHCSLWPKLCMIILVCFRSVMVGPTDRSIMISNSFGIWRALYTLNKVGIFFKCPNSLYPVSNAFGFKAFHSSSAGGCFDLNIGMLLWRCLLERVSTWCTALWPASSFLSMPLSYMTLRRVTSLFSLSLVTTLRQTSFVSRDGVE